MEYYSALKKEILTHATTWMNLKDSMLSQISQTQKGQILRDYRKYSESLLPYGK
jgi:hypothetical protein